MTRSLNWRESPASSQAASRCCSNASGATHFRCSRGPLWNRAIVASLFGIAKEKLPFRIAEAVGKWQRNKGALAARTLERAPAIDVIGETVDVAAHADAQFAIEAGILPGVHQWEAPFAEVTGYYGGRGKRHVMKVKMVTRRRKPVLHPVLSGREVWNAVGFTAEAAILRAVQAKIPQLQAV